MFHDKPYVDPLNNPLRAWDEAPSSSDPPFSQRFSMIVSEKRSSERSKPIIKLLVKPEKIIKKGWGIAGMFDVHPFKKGSF